MTRPFAHCSMDLITDLPPADGIYEASWEPEQAFSSDGDMLTLYKNQHQL